MTMQAKAYQFDVAEARSFAHPHFPTINKYTFLVQANKLPPDLPTGANARDPVGMSRRVYKDVMESLRGNEATPGSFDLMNLGITILADNVVARDKKSFEVFIRDEDGIVNGAHTARIIQSCQEDNSVPPEQFVEVRVITGISQASVPQLKADIAKGQNTGIAVKDQSIFAMGGVFDSVREIIKNEPWANDVAWKESDKGDVDVRDLVAALEVMNVIDYPNDGGSHPISAYEKWSLPLQAYADDYQDSKKNPTKLRKYAAIEPLMLDTLNLYDRIRHDFRELYNKHVNPGAGRLLIVEEAPARIKEFSFVFSGQPKNKYRLTKGAAFPILGAFRNCVIYDPEQHVCRWADGFNGVLALWDEVGPELVEETRKAIDAIGRHPDVLGKARKHWSDLHRLMEVNLLRRMMKARA
jgi:hypothetical protein